MAIYYLDVDDEITSAAARIRDSADARIALVIQGGSRLSTSRINFRLLAREARHRGRRLAIIAADASVRSLAQTADLPVFASVADYQKSESAQLAGANAAGPGAVWEALDEPVTSLEPGADPTARMAGGAGSGPTVGSSRQVMRPMPRKGRVAMRWVAVAIVGVLLVGGLGAFVLLPSATVVLTVKEEPVGPLNLTIKVDPGITATDDASLSVPGVARGFPVQASATFQATGQNVVDTAAGGTVTFTSANTGSAVTIPTGTVIETASKIAFATTATVTVPKARLVGLTVVPSTADTGVTAVKKGVSGNVAAGAIVNVPPWLATDLVVANQVTNKAATSGGTHTITPFVQQSDIDAAEASLARQLGTAGLAAMSDPSAVAGGLQLFPDTAQLGAPVFNPDPTTLLNQAVTSFDLTATATETATVADLSNVSSLAERQIRGRIAVGHALVDGSVAVTFGSPTADGSAVSVPVVAQALQTATLDVNQLRSAIEGKSAAQAKAYLSQYGVAEVSLSPFWVSTIPSFDFRIDVSLVMPTAVPSGTPHVTPAPIHTPTPAQPAPPTSSASPNEIATPTESSTPVGSETPPPSPAPTPVETASSPPSPTATP
jgi:hypothetical protein